MYLFILRVDRLFGKSVTELHCCYGQLCSTSIVGNLVNISIIHHRHRDALDCSHLLSTNMVPFGISYQSH